MSDTITGSDRVGRTLDQWKNHIFERLVFCDGDDPASVSLLKMRSAVQGAAHNPEAGEDMSERFGKAAGEWMKFALRDALDEGNTPGQTISALADSIEKLSRQIVKAEYKQQRKANVGYALLHYIEKHNDLPRERKALYDFIKGEGQSIPNRTVDEYLSWYALEKVCATYYKE